MNGAPPSYDRLIGRIAAWAQGDDNIRAAVVIGSQARCDHPADEWSDLDLILVARDPRPLIEDDGWLKKIGTPWITFLERTPDEAGFERRVLFDGGLDVDFAPIAAEEIRALAGRPLPPLLEDILRRGFRMLLDKDGFSEVFAAPAGSPPGSSAHPAESEFLNQTNDFWYHTVWAAKHLRRGQLWVAHSCCDSYMKNLLRRMIEWHAAAVRAGPVDTWMRGRFLEEWAAPEALAALPHAFARHDAEDIWRALRASMDLFRDLARETAGRRGFAYPSPAEEKAYALVEKMFSERNAHDPR